MVKANLVGPALLVVATSALGAFIAPVDIIGFVAINTVTRKFDLASSNLVAALARSSPVLPL